MLTIDPRGAPSVYYYCRLVICCCGMQLMSKQNSINPSELFAGVRLFSLLRLSACVPD